MKPIPIVLSALALTGLGACAAPVADLPPPGEPEVTGQAQPAPPGAAPGTCWAKHVTPAIIETVTHQVVLHPAEIGADGTVTRPAIYKTETRQDIVRERSETWFERPCDAVMTPDFVASVQRALAVRGHYRGPVSGAMDARTRAAVRRYQAQTGLDSGVLSLAAARKLGLVAIDPQQG